MKLNLTLNFDIKYSTFLLYLVFHSLGLYVVFKLHKSFKKFNICIINKYFFYIYNMCILYIIYLLFVILIYIFIYYIFINFDNILLQFLAKARKIYKHYKRKIEDSNVDSYKVNYFLISLYIISIIINNSNY